MSCDLPSLSYMTTLYIVSMHIVNTNSRTSTHWKLNPENGKVQTAAAMAAITPDNSDTDDNSNSNYNTVNGSDDPLMSILANTESRTRLDNGDWRLEANPTCLKGECAETNNTSDGKNTTLTNKQQNMTSSTTAEEKHTGNNNSKSAKASNSNNSKSSTAASRNEQSKRKPSSQQYSEHKQQKNSTDSASKQQRADTPPARKKHLLDCGRIVNFTQYDHLRGVAERHSHPSIPEPEVAMIFKKKNSKSVNHEVDMNELERKLRKERKENPKSAQVYNQIGNFWRIRGNTTMSIECFRKALSLSPNNSDVLLNLARVLFNLQYLDNAIELTRQSLDNQRPGSDSWLQHFTLGEILKTYGRYAEATQNFQRTLELNPGFQPAEAHLRDMEINPDGTVTYYTLFIILFLVLGVLCGILTSVDGNLEELGESIKTQRHFNRAMAMRSMKLGINPKVIRMRKQGYNG